MNRNRSACFTRCLVSSTCRNLQFQTFRVCLEPGWDPGQSGDTAIRQVSRMASDEEGPLRHSTAEARFTEDYSRDWMLVTFQVITLIPFLQIKVEIITHSFRVVSRTQSCCSSISGQCWILRKWHLLTCFQSSVVHHHYWTYSEFSCLFDSDLEMQTSSAQSYHIRFSLLLSPTDLEEALTASQYGNHFL